MRNLVFAVSFLLICIGVAAADEFSAIITKVDGKKVTFSRLKKDGTKEPIQTLEIEDGTPHMAKFNKETKKFEAGDAIEGGLKNNVFAKIPEKGLPVRIKTDEDNKRILQILVLPKKKTGK